MTLQDNKCSLLLEWKDPLARDSLPPSVSVSEEVTVDVIIPQLEDTPVIVEAVEDSNELPDASATQAGDASLQNSIVSKALIPPGTLVEKSTLQHTGFGYCKLRFFSGTQPTPSGMGCPRNA